MKTEILPYEKIPRRAFCRYCLKPFDSGTAIKITFSGLDKIFFHRPDCWEHFKDEIGFVTEQCQTVTVVRI